MSTYRERVYAFPARAHAWNVANVLPQSRHVTVDSRASRDKRLSQWGQRAAARSASTSASNASQSRSMSIASRRVAVGAAASSSVATDGRGTALVCAGTTGCGDTKVARGGVGTGVSRTGTAALTEAGSRPAAEVLSAKGRGNTHDGRSPGNALAKMTSLSPPRESVVSSREGSSAGSDDAKMMSPSISRGDGDEARSVSMDPTPNARNRAAEPAIQWARRIQYFGSVGKWGLRSPIRVQGLVVCCVLWAATARAEEAGVEPLAVAEAESVHRQSVVVDLHADTPFQLVHRGGYSLRKRNSFLQIDAPRLRAGNVGAQFFALWPPPPAVRSGRARAFCERALAAIRKAAADSGALEMVASVEGIHAARRKGRIAGLLGMEGAECLDGRAEDLDRWHAEGVRYLGLTWNFVNPFATPASGARPEDRSRGLTPLGRELVRRAHGLGVLIDVSHANQATFWDVVRTAPGPFIASHSNAFSVRSHPRNLDDEQVRAIARAKGVVGVNFHRPFLARGRAALADVVKHVLHLVRVAGAEHVALGADYDGNIQVPRGLEDPSTWPRLTRALLDAGLRARDVRRVLGENVLRVLDAAKSTSPLERVVPLAVRAVRPRAARRLFDRNERTRYANRRPKSSVRFRFDGEPSRLAFTPCGKHASFRVSLAAARTGTRESMHVRLAEGRVTVRASAKVPTQAVFRRGRVVLELPPLARSRFEVALGGVRCLREVTVYERVTPDERAR